MKLSEFSHCTTTMFAVCMIGLGFMLMCGCSSVDHRLTYQTPLNSVLITCDKCKPGEYLLSECIKDGGESVCELCPAGRYNTHHTKAKYCAQCETQCKDPDREEVASNCTSTANISCVCREGFYREKGSGICLKQADCQPGEGVKSEGDRNHKTVCEKCRKGYFSNITSATERCMECSECSSDQRVEIECTPYNDTVCVPLKQKDEEKVNVYLIVGLSVGIPVSILLAVAVAFYLCRTDRGKKWIEQHKNNCRRSSDQPENTPLNETMSYGVNGGPAGNHFSDKELQNLAGDLTNQEYFAFFRLLFDEEADKHIHEARLDFTVHGHKEIIYRILKKWQMVEKDNATKNKVIEVLRETERNDLANKYSELWKIHGNGHTDV